jgi:hypothetical protein
MHSAAAASRELLFWAVCSSAGTRASNWIMRPLAEVCLGEVSLPLLPHPLLGHPSPTGSDGHNDLHVEILKEGENDQEVQH